MVRTYNYNNEEHIYIGDTYIFHICILRIMVHDLTALQVKDADLLP